MPLRSAYDALCDAQRLFVDAILRREEQALDQMGYGDEVIYVPAPAVGTETQPGTEAADPSGTETPLPRPLTRLDQWIMGTDPQRTLSSARERAEARAAVYQAWMDSIGIIAIPVDPDADWWTQRGWHVDC